MPLPLSPPTQGKLAHGQEAGGAPTVRLYGMWQTEAWAPPGASRGRVPRNERGNVEVPPFASALPAGTRHLSSAPGLVAVCKALGFDFAPALVGFEMRGGRSVPVLDGVVVCEVGSALLPAVLCLTTATRAFGRGCRGPHQQRERHAWG